jgi:hypothetical protein
MVYVKPKGPVPVIALEWRIKEDIPLNLCAIKIASEKRNTMSTNSISNISAASKSVGMKKEVEWAVDETLGTYITDNRSSSTTSSVNTISTTSRMFSTRIGTSSNKSRTII